MELYGLEKAGWNLEERRATASWAACYLNSILPTDNALLADMVDDRRRCSGELAKALEVNVFDSEGNPLVGLLGLLRGFFGNDADGLGLIHCEKHSDGEKSIVRFYVNADAS